MAASSSDGLSASSTVEREVPSLITLVARTLAGQTAFVEISPRETGLKLKEALTSQFECALSPLCLKLVHEQGTLGDHDVLSERGVANNAELTVVIGPPVELSDEHPSLLRAYFTRHDLTMRQAWATDEGVWRDLEDMWHERRSGFSDQAPDDVPRHDVLVRKIGDSTSIIHAASREKVMLEVYARFWKSSREESCTNQLLLVMDTEVVAAFSVSVTSPSQDLRKVFMIIAPPQPGTYMLWKWCALQVSKSDALRVFKREVVANGLQNRYPDSFVGWLIVGDPI